MKIFRKIMPILILSLLSSPLLLLQSCGDKAPYGTTVTVEEFGGIDYNPDIPASDPDNATKTQYYRVTVIGTDDLPMNGIKVDVFGTIDSNSIIDFFGDVAYPGTAFNKKTENFGFFDFAVVAHVYTPLTLDPPVIVSVVGATTGGSIVVAASTIDTFCYLVSAVDATTPLPQETGPSSVEVCGTIDGGVAGIANGSVAIAWSSVYGASGYKVFGRTSGTEGLLTATPLSAATLTYTDAGTIAPGATPTGSGSISTTTGNNSISGTITVTSGASIGTVAISF